MQLDNPWVDPGRWEPQKRGVGIVEDLIRERIVQITISMIQWLWFRGIRPAKGKGRTEGTEVRIEGMVKEAKRGTTDKKGKKDDSMKSEVQRGHGMRVMQGDQRVRGRGRTIGNDIEVGVPVASGIGMGIVGGMIVIVTGTVIVIGSVIEGTGEIRLVILYIRNKPASMYLPLYLAVLLPSSLCFSHIQQVRPSCRTLLCLCFVVDLVVDSSSITCDLGSVHIPCIPSTP
jgi:hypothetical protein